MSLKYIIGTIPGKNDTKCEGPVIFPSWLDHKETADKLGIINITSTGFIKMKNGKIICYGESVSLGVQSDPMDEKIVNLFL